MRRAEIEIHLNYLTRLTDVEKAEQSRTALLALAEDAEPDLVEIVAATIFEKYHEEEDFHWPLHAGNTKRWRDVARAAIEAMAQHNGEGRTG